MNRTLPLLVSVVIVLSGAGCAHRSTSTPVGTAPVALSNAQAFDAYYVRRTDELASTGNYNRRQAAQIAEAEAIRRYGPRTTSGGTTTSSMTWPAPRSNTLSYDEIDAALKRSGR